MADLIANFNRVCDSASELGLLSSFARQRVVLVSATSILFCYYYCHRFLQLSFQRRSTSSFGWSDRYRLGDSLTGGRSPIIHQVWLTSFTDEFILDILDKVCMASCRLSSSIVSCRSGWCTSSAMIK